MLLDAKNVSKAFGENLGRHYVDQYATTFR